MSAFRLAVVGLDSSHAVEFARLIQGDAPSADRIDGLRVTACCRFASPFQSEEGQDARQRQLESWGARLAASPEEAAAEADGLVLTLNDPADHRPMFERVAVLGKPVFLDKPLADTPENAAAIEATAARAGVDLWSASSIPLCDAVARARRAVAAPARAHVYGPFGKAAAGSDVVWYGCHTFETLVALMGTGAAAARAVADDGGLAARVAFADNRYATVELVRGSWQYGGRVEGGDAVHVFRHDPAADAPVYRNLVLALRDFFLYGRRAVPTENARAALALGVAVERSLRDGGARVAVEAYSVFRNS